MTPFPDFEAFTLRDDLELPNRYELTEELVWSVGRREGPMWLHIPPGFTFDISVPKGFYWLLSPHDRSVLPAAAIHDWLLLEGYDPAFASSEFRRAALTRGRGSLYSWMLFLATLIWTEFRRR